MSDDSTTTIRATFETRAAADLAIEHLVQQHGIQRTDIFVQSSTSQNSTGTVPSGGDASHWEGARSDAPLEGEIEVSADIAANQIPAVQRSFGEAGAIQVSGKQYPPNHSPAAGTSMPYEPKPGEVSLFENEKMGSERAPDHRGYVIAHRDIKAGEKLSIALWRGKSDGARSLSGMIADLPRPGSNAPDLDLFGNIISRDRQK